MPIEAGPGKDANDIPIHTTAYLYLRGRAREYINEGRQPSLGFLQSPADILDGQGQ